MLTMRFRKQCLGIPFSSERWRKFFKRNQIFLTLCMECAYIDNMQAAALRERDPHLAKLMAQNAMKHIGAID